MDNSQKVAVHIVNAFVDNNSGGNPAGLVLDADLLTNKQKLTIAAAVGLSETAFVSQSKFADFKLDFFTPTRQIAHCGHATVAAFSYLSQLGKVPYPYSSKETIDGTREVVLKQNQAFMEQRAPVYTELQHESDRLLQSLGLTPEDVLPDAPLLIVNTGNSFAVIPVRSAEILENIRPDFEAISGISEAYDLVGFYAFSMETGNPERDATTRMFAPRYGIEEESGTGMAAGPLACYLYDQLNRRQENFRISQGRFMPRPSPSLIIVELMLEHEKITRLMVGGKGIVMELRIVEVD